MVNNGQAKPQNAVKPPNVALATENRVRQDSRNLLPIAIEELAEYHKTYQRVENNVRILVERSNHELAALALVIRQKQENIETLKKIAGGFYVKPEPPISSALQDEARQKQVADEAAAAVKSDTPKGAPFDEAAPAVEPKKLEESDKSANETGS